MMQDVNAYEDYTFTVSDENWLRFCLFFNECVDKYGTVDEELHYFRLKLNRAPATLEEMKKIIKNDNTSWVLCTIWETRYHMTGKNGEYNLKFVSSNSTNNIYEAVYNKDGILLNEKNCPENMGTYNYAGTKTNNSLHHAFDVDTYFMYGNIKGIKYNEGEEMSKFISKKSRKLKNDDAIKYHNSIEKYLYGEK